MLNVFIDLSLVILAAFIISFIAKMLKQPLIIAYIITGVIVSPFLANFLDTTTISTFSQMGIAFLLFMVGLHLNPKVIQEVGFVSLIAGLIQIVLTGVAGFFIASSLGFSFISSIYIAIALTFSSTIIVTKILSDKRDLETLYGKISLGILILQDIAVVFTLMSLSYFSKSSMVAVSLESVGYVILILASLVFISIYAMPGITKFIARNQELLFLFSIGWCFVLASLFFKLGLSMEIGALIAGMTLSISPYHTEIAAKIRPLRDFFIIIFFISLGLRIDLTTIHTVIKPVLIFSGFVIFFKFFLFMILLGIFGHSKRTSFFTSTSLGQISEFSFIIIALATSLGQIPASEGLIVNSSIILTGLITIAFSTYMMTHSNKIFQLLSKPLSVFERKRIKEKKLKRKHYDYILFGYNRIGFSLLKSMLKLWKKKDYVVVDFNPEIIRKLKAKGIRCLYGDAEDTEFLEALRIDNAKFVVSTIPGLEMNNLILNKAKKRNKKSIVILTAHKIQEALKLYENGADYVILPHFLGGNYISNIVEKYKVDRKKYKSERKKQIDRLKERIEEGQEHPEIEKLERKLS